MRGLVKNLRYKAPLLCLLLSTWASAQTQSTQPESNGSDTEQQQESGKNKSEEEWRKHYLEELSKRSLSRLTSELRVVENQINEKEVAYNSLSRNQEVLEKRIPIWKRDLRGKSTEVEHDWKTFEEMMRKLEPQNPDKPALKKARDAFNDFQLRYRDFVRSFRNISFELETQLQREYNSLSNLGLPGEWSFFYHHDSPSEEDNDTVAYEKLKKILSKATEEKKQDVPELLKNGFVEVELKLGDLRDSLKESVTRLSDELDTLKSKKELLEQVIDEKSRTDNKLTYAIYFMVAALIILYVATLFAREKIQTTIFENRTLVEMIGMAFLLLTIIILGTGEKMDRSVLGALLGTVGGYIFGQQSRSSDRPEHREQANAAGTPRKKKKATEFMTENVQRAAQEGTTTPPATKVPETPLNAASSAPVTPLQDQKPAAGQGQVGEGGG
jgi:hypothetical protein